MSYALDQSAPNPVGALVGRTFVQPSFDYLLIGGVLSLAVIGLVGLFPRQFAELSAADFAVFVLLSNSAHFAASTVRLYTKPGAAKAMPFVSIGLPLVMLAVLGLSALRAESLAPQFRAFYLSWSPYHYAAQAYGLAVMYCYRSGCLLGPANKRLLWWVAMLPFIFSFALAPRAGLHWLDVYGWLDHPTIVAFLRFFFVVMPWVALVSVPLLFWQIWRSEARPMPIISVLMLVSNGFWWFVFPPMQAFVLATIFHGIQYLAIVIIFHVKEQMSLPGNRHGAAYHTFWFYGVCLALGYGLFNLFPQVFVWAGVGRLEAMILVVATINVHHFIVDAFIWRLKKTDKNREIVDSAGAGMRPAGVAG